MAASKAGGGVTNTIKKVLMWLVGLAVLLAVLGMFHNDPFAVFNWLWGWGEHIVFGIRDFLLGHQAFRKIFTKPS